MEEMSFLFPANYTSASTHTDLDRQSCPSGSEPSSPEGEFRGELPSPNMYPVPDYLFHYTLSSDFSPEDHTFHCLSALSLPTTTDSDLHTLDSVRRKLNFDVYSDFAAKKEPGLDFYDFSRKDSDTGGNGDRSAKRELGIAWDATGREGSRKTRRVDTEKVKRELIDISHCTKRELYAEAVEHLSRYDGSVSQDSLLPESGAEAVSQSTDHSSLLVIENGEVMVRLGNGLLYDIDLGDTTPAVSPLCDHTTTNANGYNDSNDNVCLPAPVCAYQNEGYYEYQQNRTAPSYHMHETCMAAQPAKNDQNSYENGRSRRCPPAVGGVDQEDSYRCPNSGGRRRQVSRTERLWEFILRLLGDPQHNPRLIEWVEREDGTFRLNNSKAIARMWGMRKNNEQMTYEKLSRALRYYYHRKILEPVLGKKLVYRFGPKATQVWAPYTYRSQHSARHPA